LYVYVYLTVMPGLAFFVAGTLQLWDTLRGLCRSRPSNLDDSGPWLRLHRQRRSASAGKKLDSAKIRGPDWLGPLGRRNLWR
jgi:hypothetical protein